MTLAPSGAKIQFIGGGASAPPLGVNMICAYTKTLAGHCSIESMRSSDYCYYHQKVVDGLIETDEQNAVLDLPTLKT